MRQMTACVFGASLLAASGAFAQASEPASGFYITGYTELGYFDSPAFGSYQLRGDVDMGVAPVDGANGLGFGVSLGIDAVDTDFFSMTALYPALELTTGIGKFSIGAPRSVWDRGYFPEPIFGNNSHYNRNFRGSEASAIGFYHLWGTNTLLGLRYDGVFGNTKLGSSYHNLDIPGGDLDSFAVAVSHTFSGPNSLIDFMIYGGIEHHILGAVEDTSYRIGIESKTDKITAGLSYTYDNLPVWVRVVSAHLDYTFWDVLTVTGSLGHSDNAGGLDFYGLGVQYDFSQNAYAKASVVATDAGSSPIFEVMLGWQF